MRNILVPLACAIALAGCADTLNPAPPAHALPGPAAGAITHENGIELIARAGAWQGTPADLASRLTPMQITLENDGNVPVRVSYDNLMLVAPDHTVYKALPPFQIEGEATKTIGIVPLYPSSHFLYAPYFSTYISGATIYPGVFPYDRVYWQRYARVLREVDLPSADMLRKALPEGVLMPGGKVSGFVYFPGVGDDVERVRLRAVLVDANSGQKLASPSIPFVVG